MNDPSVLLGTELSGVQLAFLRIIARPYRDSGVWPTWNYVEDQAVDLAEEFRTEPDAWDLLRGLPRVGVTAVGTANYGFTNYGSIRPSEADRINLTVAAAVVLPEMHPLLALPFLTVLKRMVELRRGWTSPATEVTHPRLTQIDARTYQLLDNEHVLQGSHGEGGPDEPTWWWEVRRDVLRYRDLGTPSDPETLRRYVEITYKHISDQARPYQAMLRQVQAAPVAVSDPFALRVPPPGRVVVSAADAVAKSAIGDAIQQAQGDVFVPEELIAELEEAGAKSVWEVDRLVGLLRELNANYGEKRTYACLALIRAVMDHLAPLFGAPPKKGFTTVAASYDWGQTDRKHALALETNRLLGDDVLHRQIQKRKDVLRFADLPKPIELKTVLSHAVKELQHQAP